MNVFAIVESDPNRSTFKVMWQSGETACIISVILTLLIEVFRSIYVTADHSVCLII